MTNVKCLSCLMEMDENRKEYHLRHGHLWNDDKLAKEGGLEYVISLTFKEIIKP